MKPPHPRPTRAEFACPTCLAPAGPADQLLPVRHRANACQPALDASFNLVDQSSQPEVEAGPGCQHPQGNKRVAVTQFSIDFITQDNVMPRPRVPPPGASVMTGYYALVGVGEPSSGTGRARLP